MVTNEEILRRVDEKRPMLNTVLRRAEIRLYRTHSEKKLPVAWIMEGKLDRTVRRKKTTHNF